MWRRQLIEQACIVGLHSSPRHLSTPSGNSDCPLREAAETVRLQTVSGLQWVDFCGHGRLETTIDASFVSLTKEMLALHGVPADLIDRINTKNWLPQTHMSRDRRSVCMMCRSARIDTVEEFATTPRIHSIASSGSATSPAQMKFASTRRARFLSWGLDRARRSADVSSYFIRRMIEERRKRKQKAAGGIASVLPAGAQDDTDSYTSRSDLSWISHRLTIFVLLDQRKIITVHRERILHIHHMQSQWNTLHRSKGDLESILFRMVRNCANSFLIAEQRHIEAIDDLERRIFGKTAQRYSSDMKELYSIKRQAASYLRVLRVLLKAYDKLIASCEIEAPQHTKALQHTVTSSVVMCESLHEQSVSLLSLQFSAAASELEHMVQVLTVFSTVFIPLEVITAMGGMNFPAVEEAGKSQFGLYGVLLAMLVCGFTTGYWMRGQASFGGRAAAVI